MSAERNPCSECGATLWKRRPPTALTCSSECSRARANRLRASKRPSVARRVKCSECSIVFSVSGSSRALTCSRKCGAQREVRLLAEVRAERVRARAEFNASRVCRVCNAPMPLSALRHAVTCGPVCSKGRKAQRKKSRKRQAPERACKQCGLVFPPGTHGRRLRCEPCQVEYRAVYQQELARSNRIAEKKDAYPPVDWALVARRVAERAGPESAVLLARELNKHRQRNGLPEVRL